MTLKLWLVWQQSNLLKLVKCDVARSLTKVLPLFPIPIISRGTFSHVNSFEFSIFVSARAKRKIAPRSRAGGASQFDDSIGAEDTEGVNGDPLSTDVIE